MPHRFLWHRAAVARRTLDGTVAVSAARISDIVVHASTLADRIEALPAPGDLVQRRERVQRVARLRSAVAAGEASLQRQGVDRDLADASSDGAS